MVTRPLSGWHLYVTESNVTLSSTSFALSLSHVTLIDFNIETAAYHKSWPEISHLL